MFNPKINPGKPVVGTESKLVVNDNDKQNSDQQTTKSFDQTFGSGQVFYPGQAQLFKPGNKKVVVIDDKYQKIDADKKASINGQVNDAPDNIPDIPHGEVVKCFIAHETELKPLDQNYKPVTENISNHLQDVIDNENPDDVGAINISVQVNYPIDKLSEYSGVEGLTPENLKEKAPAVVSGLSTAVANNLDAENEYRSTPEYRQEKQVRQSALMQAHQKLQTLEVDSPEYNKAYEEFATAYTHFKEIDKYQELGQIVQIHDQIDQLSEKDIPVCISSGNSGGLDAQYVNLLTLNEKAIVTGARDSKTGAVSNYSQNNSLVDVSFKSNTATNIDGKLDINADGTGDIDVQNFSKAKTYLAQNPNANPATLDFNVEVEGTSVMSPQASDLAAYMKEQGIKPAQMNEIFRQADEMVNKDPSLTVKQAIAQIISSD